MNITRKGWLVVGLGFALALGVVGCQADDGPTGSVTKPETAGEAMLQAGGLPMPLLHRLDRKLNLSDTQRAAVRAILQRERQAMFQSGVPLQGREAVRAAIEARRERVGDEIAGLLTPEQKATFARLRARLRERLAGGFGQGEVLARELGLSAAQQERVRSMLEERHGALREVHAQVRAGTLTRPELRRRAKAEREAFRAQLETLLTPEQQARFRKLAEEWKQDFEE